MEKDCCNCEWDDMCGWKFRGERGYCDKWQLEDGGNEDDERRQDSADE